jgi:hypothetical protein
MYTYTYIDVCMHVYIITEKDREIHDDLEAVEEHEKATKILQIQVPHDMYVCHYIVTYMYVYNLCTQIHAHAYIYIYTHTYNIHLYTYIHIRRSEVPQTTAAWTHIHTYIHTYTSQ